MVNAEQVFVQLGVHVPPLVREVVGLLIADEVHQLVPGQVVTEARVLIELVGLDVEGVAFHHVECTTRRKVSDHSSMVESL